ncbi:MAG: response regulator [Planctomycetes bacterium]|nr:response regulator [Planctomycetota bacterium]HKB15257.1 response regulator [Planctomycetota bacterium]
MSHVRAAYYSILVADDQVNVREGMAEILERQGYRVLRAEGGVVALEIATRESVDCSILDVHMPDLSGLDVVRRLPLSPRAIPSILMSGEPSPELEREALSAGAFTFLRKPVSPQTLRACVARALAGLEPLR